MRKKKEDTIASVLQSSILKVLKFWSIHFLFFIHFVYRTSWFCCDRQELAKKRRSRGGIGQHVFLGVLLSLKHFLAECFSHPWSSMSFSKTFSSTLVPLGFRSGSRHESDLLAKNAFVDIPFSSSHGAKDFLELDAHLHLGNSQRDIADDHKAICILHAQDSWRTCLDHKSCSGRRGISGCGGEGQILWRNDSNWEASQKISSRKKSVWVCLCRFLGKILQDLHLLPQNSSKFYTCCCHLLKEDNDATVATTCLRPLEPGELVFLEPNAFSNRFEAAINAKDVGIWGGWSGLVVKCTAGMRCLYKAFKMECKMKGRWKK